jgi:hypothetical protein
VLLGDLKAACEALMPADAEWKPSCCLVDNSDAEINAARCVHTQFCASSRSQACIILRSKLLVHTTLFWMGCQMHTVSMWHATLRLWEEEENSGCLDGLIQLRDR